MRTNWGAMIIALGIAAVCVTAGAAQGQGAKVSVAEHEGFMKSISSTNAALRKKVMSNDLASAATDAQMLARLFNDVERFWAQNDKSDAVKWAQDGEQAATDLAGALKAGDATEVAALQKQMAGSCGSCHKTYREGSPQTGYNLKAGVVTP